MFLRPRLSLQALAIALTPLALAALLAEAAPRTAEGLSPDEEINVRVYREVSPAVVNITTTTLVRDFFDVYPQKGAGTGFLLDMQGHILTNHHVVAGARELEITLADGSRHKGKLVGADPENDLAIIKLTPPHARTLATVRLGDSKALQVGQRVLAIGNPFGLQHTLTTGVISAVGRPLTDRGGRLIENVIQTDASINPGNSGGPLLNTRGEVIGINTAIFTPSGGSVGIGFAIPIETAKQVIPDLIAQGKPIRPWVGIVSIPLSPRLASALEIPVKEGLLVSEVVRGGPAERAGIRGGTRATRLGELQVYLGGDILVKMEGKPIRTHQELMNILKTRKAGERIKISGYRGPREMTWEVVLQRPPAT